MLKYLEFDSDGRVNYIHDQPFDKTHGLGKTESELLKSGVLVDHIPVLDIPIADGKEPVLFYVDGILKYEQIDIPKSSADLEMEQLKEQLKIMQTAIDDLIMGGMM